MTGACHAPVNGRQGKALDDIDPNASLVSTENPQIGSGRSERKHSFAQMMGGACSEGQAATMP